MSPERLRRELLRDLTNVALRGQYLSVRTPELRELDGLSNRLQVADFVAAPLAGLSCGLVCGTVSWWNFDWILRLFNGTNPAWVYWFVGWTLIGCAVGVAAPFQQLAAKRLLAEELGPLPPDVPDKPEEVRALLLGHPPTPGRSR